MTMKQNLVMYILLTDTTTEYVSSNLVPTALKLNYERNLIWNYSLYSRNCLLMAFTLYVKKEHNFRVSILSFSLIVVTTSLSLKKLDLIVLGMKRTTDSLELLNLLPNVFNVLLESSLS